MPVEKSKLLLVSAAVLSAISAESITFEAGFFVEPSGERAFPTAGENPDVRAYFKPGDLSGPGTQFYWGGLRDLNGNIHTEYEDSDEYGLNTSYFQFDSYYDAGSPGTVPTNPGADPLEVGTFTYFNGLSSAGTGVTDVDLTIVVDGDEVVFPLFIRNIYNSDGNDAGSADIVRFLERSISIPNENGQFLNLAFTWPAEPPQPGNLEEIDDEGRGNAFSVEEGVGVTATLLAWTSSEQLPPVDDPNQVPDGGTTAALLGMAFLGLGLASRKGAKFNESIS